MVFNPATSIWNRELNRMRQTASSIVLLRLRLLLLPSCCWYYYQHPYYD